MNGIVMWKEVKRLTIFEQNVLIELGRRNQVGEHKINKSNNRFNPLIPRQYFKKPHFRTR